MEENMLCEPLRKNAVQYLQAVAFKDQYIEGQFNDTYTEDLLLDVFTGSHPYAPFTIGTLCRCSRCLSYKSSFVLCAKTKCFRSILMMSLEMNYI